MMSGQSQPDFIGVGMERAGTSWLYYILASHPQIWVPPIKELHYFDSIENAGLAWRFGPHLKMRIRAKLAPLMKSRAARPQYFKNSYGEYLAWDRAYFSGHLCHDWYRRLFGRQYTRGRVCGEITAAYATLKPETIAGISRDFSGTKILLSLRDPVERTISSLFHYIRGTLGKDPQACTESELLSWVRAPQTQERSNARDILKRWHDHIPAKNLIVIDFARIGAVPESVVLDLYRRLGVDYSFQPPSPLIREKIFSFRKQEDVLPASVMQAILDLYGAESAALASFFKRGILTSLERKIS